jgi:hypothetical protein
MSSLSEGAGPGVGVEMVVGNGSLGGAAGGPGADRLPMLAHFSSGRPAAVQAVYQ